MTGDLGSSSHFRGFGKLGLREGAGVEESGCQQELRTKSDQRFEQWWDLRRDPT